jgi:transcriptional regulator with XRE-family HTH domain
MVIDDRLKELREAKELSQDDIEKRTGLLRCYISRVENNHTVPAVDTLGKLAGALEVPMYQLFHAGTASPDVQKLSGRMTTIGSNRERRRLHFSLGESSRPDDIWRPQPAFRSSTESFQA